MYRKNYRLKKTISIKQFVSEFDGNLSEHIKKRLMELEIRCVLTRKEERNVLDLKHVEHTKYNCKDTKGLDTKKEYAYGEFITTKDEEDEQSHINAIYFSEKCMEDDEIMQSPIVDTIYNSLDSQGMISLDDKNAKRIDDSNIDYIVDTILKECPDVSQKYIDIIKQMNSYFV